MADSAPDVDTTSDNTEGQAGAEVRTWLNEIAAARKRDKDFRKDGQRIIEIYEGQRKEQTPFNILYSNTETLRPALYSAIPRPVVERRFKDDDPIGKAASHAGRRMLEFLLDTNIDGYETFDDGMKAATLDGLLPGRGVTAVKYDAEFAKDGEVETKKSELVCLDSKVWNRVYIGYAKKWNKVPWVAFEDYLDREECERLFGDKAARIQYTVGEDEGDEREESRSDDDERNLGERKTALVYQIWDKDGGRKVRYVSPQFVDDYLRVDDDPLGLTGFYNIPRPLQFVEKNDTCPVGLYVLYENQAKELNKLTIRISRIVDAIKARGVYDSELGEDLKNLMTADDNELVPAEKGSSLAAEKGLQNAIWFMPVQELIIVLRELLVSREQVKQTIYEITGIADIMRGASKASETLGAQQIKNQWGTLRIKPKQAEVQRYARDLLRIMLEIAASKFSEVTWQQMTGLPFITSQQMMQAQLAGSPLPEGAVPWPAVLELLKNDLQRAYRIDIETNSTIEPEAAEDQKNIADLMNAMGQFINGVGPLVQQGVMPFQVAQTMLLSITRRFRFGSDIEDQIKAMQPPQKDDAETQAMQQQLQQLQQQLQQTQQGLAQAQQEAQATKQHADLEKKAFQVALKELQFQASQAAADTQAAARQETMEHERALQEIQAKKTADLAKLAAERDTARVKAEIERDTELRKAEIQANTQIRIAEISSEAKVRASAVTAAAKSSQGDDE